MTITNNSSWSADMHSIFKIYEARERQIRGEDPSQNGLENTFIEYRGLIGALFWEWKEFLESLGQTWSYLDNGSESSCIMSILQHMGHSRTNMGISLTLVTSWILLTLLHELATVHLAWEVLLEISALLTLLLRQPWGHKIVCHGCPDFTLSLQVQTEATGHKEHKQPQFIRMSVTVDE